MKHLPQNDTRERIMDAAEALFMARGFSAVKLRDIADAVGMKHASLYYYVPKGKDQLFAEVVRRSMARHHEQMNRVIAQAGDDFREQVYAVSDWLVSQPPLDLMRMADVDLPSLSPELAKELEEMIMQSINEPMVGILWKASESGTVTIDNPIMASMSLMTILQAVHYVPSHGYTQDKQVFGRKLVDMLLNGWLTR